MKALKVLVVILGVFLVLSCMLFAASGIVVLAAPDQLIHALNGKTMVEYNMIVTGRNQTQADLDKADQAWNSLLCKQTWAQATDPNTVFFAPDNPDKSFRKYLNGFGFDFLLTQWKPYFDENLPSTVMIRDLHSGIIFNITDHCIILKDTGAGQTP